MPLERSFLWTNCCRGVYVYLCVSHCSAVMYPSDWAEHGIPATSTRPCSSERVIPRFTPRIVTNVPPSGGPARGVTYTERRKERKKKRKQERRGYTCIRTCLESLETLDFNKLQKNIKHLIAHDYKRE